MIMPTDSLDQGPEIQPTTPRMETPKPTWSLAIFSSREDVAMLVKSIAQAVNATRGRDCVIDVLVNGNDLVARQLQGALARSAGLKPGGAPDTSVNPERATTVRVWSMQVANKSQTWNEYLRSIWPGSELAFFLDGYVSIKQQAIELVARRLDLAPDAMIASGVPTTGRSAKALGNWLVQSQLIHGNFYVVRGQAMKALRSCGFRLPTGMYYPDALVQAAICYDFNPAGNAWDPRRVLVDPGVTWEVPPRYWWRLSDLRSYIRRMFSKANGLLEHHALRWILNARKPQLDKIPEHVEDLILPWIKACPKEAWSLYLRNPLCFLGARRIRRARVSRKADAAPTPGPDGAAPVLTVALPL